MTPYWDSLLADPFPEVKLCFCGRGAQLRGTRKTMVWDFSQYLIECPGEVSLLHPESRGRLRDADVPDA
jgi:hypothetical protein